jgi:hypothetical protein
VAPLHGAGPAACWRRAARNLQSPQWAPSEWDAGRIGGGEALLLANLLGERCSTVGVLGDWQAVGLARLPEEVPSLTRLLTLHLCHYLWWPLPDLQKRSDVANLLKVCRVLFRLFGEHFWLKRRQT